MNTLDYQYLWLLRKIKEDGVKKETRNGATRSIFGYQLRHNMSEGFPLLTTKKMFWKGIRVELEWFLDGATNIQPLVQRGVNIWVGDAYKIYMTKQQEYWDEWLKDTSKSKKFDDGLSESEFIERIKNDDEFAEKWGKTGPIYPHQWRNWGGSVVGVNGKRHTSSTQGIDQIQKLIDDINEKPDSRRLMVNAWNVGELDMMLLPPCHYGFQCWTRKLTLRERADAIPRVLSKEKVEYYTEHGLLSVNAIFNNEHIPDRGITLMWNQRSVDTPLGLPFNIASYGLLLEMIADEVMMLPLELIGNLGDCHVYENQLEGVEEQLTREGHELPEIHVRDGIYSRGEGDIFFTKEYKSESAINFPLSN